MAERPTQPIEGLRGRVIHAPEYGALEEWRDGAVAWDAQGSITAVGRADDVMARYPRARFIDARPALVLPGLVDAHTHLPQYPAAGVGLGAGALLPWLERYIFPLERRFDVAAANALAPTFFAALAHNGTSAAGVYLAVYEDSAEACFDHGATSGLRLWMGKMMMDDLTYSTTAPTRVREQSLEETDRLCRTWHGHDGGRIRYAVSPRFAMACSEELMRGAAEIANWYGAGIQTHLAENEEELRAVAARFPGARDYTDVYARVGLLGPRTVVGHAVHLSDSERDTLAATGTRAAHCPTSNLFLASGTMAVDRMMRAGVGVALGSDVAAGPELSMWRVMRAAVEARNTRAAREPDVDALAARHAFHLATQAGADALGFGDVAGSLTPGKDADILVADPAAAAPPGLDPGGLDADEVISLCVFRGGPQLTRRLYVRGRAVW